MAPIPKNIQESGIFSGDLGGGGAGWSGAGFGLFSSGKLLVISC